MTKLSKEPTMNFQEFLMGEVRYPSLKKQFTDVANALFDKTEQDANVRLENYRRLAEQCVTVKQEVAAAKE
jgi:pyruvate-ferredoxin/flavodoxin oxidoreductase